MASLTTLKTLLTKSPKMPRRVGQRKEGKAVAERRKSLSSGRLFEDREFPPNHSSLNMNTREVENVIWKRPQEICSDPKFFLEGISKGDVAQGRIRNCWFVAALADLTLSEEFFYNVCPKNQSFERGFYSGMFHFNFWRFGEWQEVIIDDYLPTVNGKLFFTRSRHDNEFWSALLEKAYAKICGSYGAMGLGRISEALQDFTGGIIEIIELNRQIKKDYLLNLISKAHDRQSLMGCSIEAQGFEKVNEEGYLPNGLLTKHAYSITDLTTVSLSCIKGRPDVDLLRIRNPHANESEWKGPWSDRSPEWTMLSSKERERLNLTFDDDGEFWMSIDDFLRNFTRLEICLLTPDNVLNNSKKQWHLHKETGRWQRGVSAGGCRNFIETFHTNPQFRINLQNTDDDNRCSIVISLMRVDRRTRSNMRTRPALGFAVYEIPSEPEYKNSGLFNRDFFEHNKAIAMTKSFSKLRDITCRYDFPPGEYLIVPSTYEPNKDVEFLLRIFSETEHKAKEIDQETKMDKAPKVVITQQDANEIDRRFWDDFHRNAGEDGELDQYDLQALLTKTYRKELNNNQFCLEACRSMISMFDTDRSGALGYNEFRALRILMVQWEKTFRNYDKDHSGDMNIYELRRALKSLGYSLSNAALSSVVLRYHNKRGTISFDTFMQIVVRVIVMFDTFRKNSIEGSKKASFTMDQFIESTLTI